MPNKRIKEASPANKSAQPKPQRFKPGLTAQRKEEAARKKAALEKSAGIAKYLKWADKKVPTNVGTVPEFTRGNKSKNDNDQETSEDEIKVVKVVQTKTKGQIHMETDSEGDYTPVKNKGKGKPARVSLDPVLHSSSEEEWDDDDDNITQQLQALREKKKEIDAVKNIQFNRRSTRSNQNKYASINQYGNLYEEEEDDDDQDVEFTPIKLPKKITESNEEGQDETEEQNSKPAAKPIINRAEKEKKMVQMEDSNNNKATINNNKKNNKNDKNTKNTNKNNTKKEKEDSNTDEMMDISMEELGEGDDRGQMETTNDEKETKVADDDEEDNNNDNDNNDTEEGMIVDNEEDDQEPAEESKNDGAKRNLSASFAEVAAKPPAPKAINNKKTTPASIYEYLRLPLKVRTPADDAPMEAFAKIVAEVLATIQKTIHKNIGIAPWRDGYASTIYPVIWEVSKLPKGTEIEDAKTFGSYFNSHINPRADSDNNCAHLKLRLIWKKSTRIIVPNNKIAATVTMHLKKLGINATLHNPYACQCADPEGLGWLLYSAKSMNSDKMELEVRKALDIPDDVIFGLQFRVIKNRHKKQYSWDKAYPAPQALHIDIDSFYSLAYAPKFSKLWKKNANLRINGTQLRMIPCTSSFVAEAASPEVFNNIVNMAYKHQWFINKCLKQFDNPFILNLDHADPDGPDPEQGEKARTLRRLLLAKCIPGSFTKRAIHSIDTKWNNDDIHVISAIAPYVMHARKIMNDILPFCKHHHPNAVQYWFTPRALEIYKDHHWSPEDETVSTKANRDMQRIFDENVWDMDEQWKSMIPSEETKEADGKTVDLTNLPDESRTLQVMADADDIASFGGNFGRERSDASIEADKKERRPERVTDIQFDKETLDKDNEKDEDRSIGSLSQSTAGATTNSTRQKLKETQENQKRTLKENEELAIEVEELRLEKEKEEKDRKEMIAQAEVQRLEMEAMRAELEQMRKAGQATMTSTGTEADGAGGKI